MRRLPNLKSLHVFEVVARCGSLTRAADELCVGQSAISHQIQALEAFLGVTVFIRKRHGVTLTPEGRLLATACSRAFQDLATVINHIRPRATEATLQVKVGPFFSMKLIAPRISNFLTENPGVQIHLARLEAAAANTGSPDIVIDYSAHEPQDQPADRETGRIAIELLREQLVPVCSPRLYENTIPIQELLSGNRLHYRNLSEWQNWIASSRLTLPPARQEMIFDDQHTILEAAKEGQGVALIDRSMIGEELRTGQLRQVHAHFFRPVECYLFRCEASLFETKPVTSKFLQWLQSEIELRRNDGPATPLQSDLS